jgi:hypothetical protein
LSKKWALVWIDDAEICCGATQYLEYEEFSKTAAGYELTERFVSSPQRLAWCCVMKLTIHIHLVPMPRMLELNLHSPVRLRGTRFN